LIALLCGSCGNPTSEKIPPGKYSGTSDLIAVWNALEAGSPLEDYLSLDREALALSDAFTLRWQLILQEDGRYSLSCETLKNEEAAKTVIDTLSKGLDAYFADTNEELNRLTPNGDAPGITEEELNALKEEIADAFNDFVGTQDRVTLQGRYRIEKGSLYLSGDPNSEPDASASAIPYSLKGDSLTLNYAGGIQLTREA